jgi:hypothetical protein
MSHSGTPSLRSQIATARALLADDSLIEAARTQILAEKQAEALTNLDRVLREYPNTDRRDEVLFTRAGVIEATGKPDDAIAAYQQVAPNDAKSVWNQQAQDAILRIRKAQNMLQRKFDAESVAQFQVLKVDDQRVGRDTVIVSVATTLSPRQVQATMEDALLKHYENRKTPTDNVVLEAWFNYPITRAGVVNWTPGKEPAYTVDERKSEDVVKDAIFDLLRNR